MNFKKLASSILAAGMILSVSASAAVKDGVYTGEANGFGGKIVVEEKKKKKGFFKRNK